MKRLKVMEFLEKNKKIILIVLFVVSLLLPQVVSNSLLMRYACNILMWSVLAGSLNIINGYSGQFCIGQAGFFAIGAYFCAFFMKNFGVSFWLLLPLAGVATMMVGLLVSLPTLKLSGIYLAIVTLGFSEIIRAIAQTWEPVTGGSLGIKQIPFPWLFGLETFRPQNYYYIFLLLLLLFLFTTSRVIKSRVGRAWLAIREDEVAARSLGVKTRLYKSLNFMYGSFWAGVIGAAYAPFVSFIESSQFSLDTGFNVLAMIVIGGQGTLIGPIVGSVIYTFTTESLRFMEQWRYVIYAIVIIAMMWGRPQGLVGASNSILSGKALKIDMKKAKEGEEA